MDPVCIDLLVLTWLFGRPAYDLIEERFAGAVDTAEILAVVCLDRPEAPEQKLPLYNEVIENEPPEESVLTSLFDSSERLNISIHYMFEILNNLGQVSLNFFNRARVN